MSGRLIILGASGHGKAAADIAMRSGYEEILFLDDSPQAGSCLGWPVLGPVSEAEDLQGDFLWPLETPRCGRAPKPVGRAGEGPCHPDSPLRRPGNRSQRRLRQRPHGGSHRQSLRGNRSRLYSQYRRHGGPRLQAGRLCPRLRWGAPCRYRYGGREVLNRRGRRRGQ